MNRILIYSFFLSSYYLYLVVLPQGVRGYLTALVRPPWGWSTGFIATPRTIGLTPNFLQKPDLVLLHFLCSLKATGSRAAKE